MGKERSKISNMCNGRLCVPIILIAMLIVPLNASEAVTDGSDFDSIMDRKPSSTGDAIPAGNPFPVPDAVGSWSTSSIVFPTGSGSHRLVSHNGWLIAVGVGSGPSTAVYKTQVLSNGDIGPWMTTTSLPGTRSSHGVAIYNNKIYAVGGLIGGPNIANTVYYASIDASGNVGTWYSAPTLPNTWMDGTLAACNGYLYAIGGGWGSSTPTDYVYYTQLDASGIPGSWSSTTPLGENKGRLYFDNLIYNSRIYVPGGYHGTMMGTSNTVHYASCGSGPISSWSTTSYTLPEALERHSAAMDTDKGELYVMGGFTSSYIGTVRIGTINPSTGNIATSWATGPSLPNPWGYGGAAYTPSARAIHYTGGYHNTNGYSNATYYGTTGPMVTLTAPNGGESWTGGASQWITWTTIYGATPYTITLKYSNNGGGSYSYTIATGISQTTPGSSSYSWMVPSLNSNLMRVRIDVVDAQSNVASDTSNGNFEIDSTPPSVTSTNPSNGATNVFLTSQIRVLFNEGMNMPITQSAVSISGPGSPSLTSPSWNGAQLTFQPSGLSYSSTYTVTVSTAARDDSLPGKNMGSPYMFSFTTRPPIPSAPLNPSTNVEDRKVTISWTNPSDSGGSPITAFRLYRGTTSGAETFLVMLSGSTMDYTDKNVKNGVTYYYQISARNANGEGPKSNEVSAVPCKVPNAPRRLVVTPGNGEVTLSWLAPSNNGGSAVTLYKVYRSPDGLAFSLAGNTGSLMYIDEGLMNGVIQYYRVSAVNSAGEGSFSAMVSTTPVGPPVYPGGFYTSEGFESVILYWTAPSDNGGSEVTSYRIYRGLTVDVAFYLSVSAVSTSYNDTLVDPGTMYYYQVSAVNVAGEGPMSGASTATPYTYPGSPRSLVATSGNGQITLTWNAPLSNGGSAIFSYDVLRDTSPGATSWYITISGSVLSYIDSGISSGITYFYRIRAVNSAGYSPLSNEANATAKGTPSAPTLASAVGGSKKVTLTWTVPSSNGGSAITSYQIWRGTTSGAETFLISVSGGAVSGTDWWAAPGVTYYYKVRAVNAAGPGTFSNTLDAAATASTPFNVPVDNYPLMPGPMLIALLMLILVVALSSQIRNARPSRRPIASA